MPWECLFQSLKLGLVQRSIRAHESLTNYVVPSDGDANCREAAGRFISLVILASFLIPPFIFQYSYSGYQLASIGLMIASAIMISSLWVYRATGVLWIARDTFLGALYIFFTWETFYFGSVYSPGMIWYTAMPVASVLLGSYRAGFIWLLLNCASSFISLLLVGDASNYSFLLGGFELLYTLSVIGLIVAVFIFILMIDIARARAYHGLHEANEAIRTRAETDELTGLLNRRAVQDMLSAKLGRLPSGDQLAVLILDLDGFKDVNDTHGHEVGDQLIKLVAKGLQHLGHQRLATVGRLGGDEFAVLICGEEARQNALHFASDTLKLVQHPFAVGTITCIVGVSIGIAVTDTPVEAAELLRQADVAMYQAKKGGKSRACVHDASMDASRKNRSLMARELEIAIQSGAIQVHYQPIVDSQNRQILAVEALARWGKEDGSYIPPDEFISVAEEAGLINQLGMLVLRQACEQAAEWPEVRLSVNLSPVQFRSLTLVDDIRRILEETSFPTVRLELEVTEGYLIEHKEQAQPLLSALQEMGVAIALDDFGTGYSSIGYLREYKFDRLKIDKSLVRGLLCDPAAQSIIQATTLLAESLSLSITAEGVEDEREAQLLHLAGCGNLQGYLFGKPQPAASISILLRQNLTGQEYAA